MTYLNTYFIPKNQHYSALDCSSDQSGNEVFLKDEHQQKRRKYDQNSSDGNYGPGYVDARGERRGSRENDIPARRLL